MSEPISVGCKILSSIWTSKLPSAKLEVTVATCDGVRARHFTCVGTSRVVPVEVHVVRNGIAYILGLYKHATFKEHSNKARGAKCGLHHL
jgi:hypothetical protein